jgi:uncharacterized integral membrane protein (TIGR00698 family)
VRTTARITAQPSADSIVRATARASSTPVRDAASPSPDLTAHRSPAPRGLGALRPVLLGAAVAALLIWPVPGFAALLAGLVGAALLGSPSWSARGSQTLLKVCVVALGAGLDLGVVLRAGADGFSTAALTLGVALAVGALLAKVLRVDRETAILVTLGTAICGGSAIAAAAPVLRARPGSIGVAIGIVFLLNAVALIVFPALGAAFGLSAESYGLWCALAIHDTSSVVGAAASGGPEALEIATVTKLARALWILPVCAVLSIAIARREPGTKGGRLPRVPLFIVLFVGAAALVSLVPALAPAGQVVAGAGRHGLTVALFAIGLSITPAALRSMNWRQLALGLGLWIVLGAVALALVA